MSIERFLLEQANKEVERLKAQEKRILCLFDGRVREKPESSTLEASGPGLSSKAKRLNRVMGMQWTGTIMTGLEGIPKLAIMGWWTTKGDDAENLRKTRGGSAAHLCL